MLIPRLYVKTLVSLEKCWSSNVPKKKQNTYVKKIYSHLLCIIFIDHKASSSTFEQGCQDVNIIPTYLSSLVYLTFYENIFHNILLLENFIFNMIKISLVYPAVDCLHREPIDSTVTFNIPLCSAKEAGRSWTTPFFH